MTKRNIMRASRARHWIALPLLLGVAACGGGADQGDGDAAAGAPVEIDADLSIAENLAANDALTGFHGLVGSAGLTEALAGIGPYTVFAPGNGAIEDLGDLGDMEMPARAALVSYHIVPGLMTAADIEAAIEAEEGAVELATLTGATLSASSGEDGLTITDGAGNAVTVTGADLVQQNGVIHTVSGVLQPN